MTKRITLKRSNNTYKKMHNDAKNGSPECPYCPATFCNMGGLNVRSKKGRCANEPPERQDRRWTDVQRANQMEYNEESKGGHETDNRRAVTLRIGAILRKGRRNK